MERESRSMDARRMAGLSIERDEVVALLFNVSDIAAGVEAIVRLLPGGNDGEEEEATKTERAKLNAFLDRMSVNTRRTRELAERGQAKLDAERSGR